MLDAHVHLERGPYSRDWLERFITVALERGITEICFLEHSHRFREFRPVYEAILAESPSASYQADWLEQRNTLDLARYQDFAATFNRSLYPINIHFGLETCYFEDKEEIISRILARYQFDFVTGAVHWIDGWGFDHPHAKGEWERRDVNDNYIRYYEIMNGLVSSGLFSRLAHPDSIKCFGFSPSIRMDEIYRGLARNLRKRKMSVEHSAGLRINYDHKELGMNALLLEILKEEKCEIVTASDAHRPEDVGLYIKELSMAIERCKSPDGRFT